MAVYNLYDRAADKWITAPETDATSMVASGKYGLQSGITVPVTHIDGSQSDLPSDAFEAAARSGQVRFRYDVDNQNFEDQQKEAIQEKNFGQDNTLNALSQGALRGGTLGLSDPIMEGMGALSGHGADVKSALAQTKERNPVASGVGEVGGALLSAPVAGGAEAVGALGERLGAGALSTLGKSTAARIVQNIGTTAVKEAATGAFYGLGSGISEAALGDPSQVAENLAGSVEMGALFGGAFGGAFGAAKSASPFALSAVSKVTGLADDLVGGALRKTAATAISATLSAQGEHELAKLAGGIALSPELREAYFKGGPQAVKDALSQASEVESGITKQAASLKDKLDNFLATSPKRIERQIQSDLAASSGNISDMLKTQLADLETQKTQLFGAMKADQAPGGMLGTIEDETVKTIKALERTKDPKALSVARDLETRFEGELSANQMGRNPTYDAHGEGPFDQQRYNRTLSAGQEGILGYELKGIAARGAENDLSMAARDILNEYHGSISYLSKKSPFGADLAALQDKHDVFDKARAFATGALKDTQNTNVKSGILTSILSDPRKARDFDTLFGNLSRFMPEMQAYHAAGNDAVAKMTALREASSKFDALSSRAFDRGLTLDDMQHAFDSFGSTPEHITQNMGKLRDLEQVLNQQDPGAISKYIRMMKLAGKDVSPEIAALQKHEVGFQVLDKLSARAGKASEQSHMQQFMMSMGIERAARKFVGKAAGAVVGATVGGYLGDAGGAAAGALLGGGLNTFNMMKQLTRIEGISSGALKAINKSIALGTAALTSSAAQKVGSAVAGMELPHRSMQERRADFKARSAHLTQLASDPNALANEAAKRVAGLEALPNVAAAVSKQFTDTALHLANTMPKDPLAGSFLSAHHSTWQPSDMQLMAWEKRVDVATNPMHAIQAIAKGTVSPEQVDTFKTLYPSHFERLQQSVTDAIMKPDTHLSYQAKMTIGRVLDVQADPSLAPASIKSLQAQFNEQQAGRPQQQAPKGFHPARLDLNIDAMTPDTQRLSK